MGEHCETFGEILLLTYHAIWQFKFDGGEIPNGLNAGKHH